jgi:hypothetical protein
MRREWLLQIAAAFVGVVQLAGCTSRVETDREKESKPAVKDKEEEDHTHGTGPHGGAVGHWGRYHFEFTVDHKKQKATVYILKTDVKTPAPIKTKRLLLKIKEPPFEVELEPVPQEKDPAGESSRFAGKHERLGKEQEFEGTVTGKVGGKTLSGTFKEEPEEKK